MKRRRLVLILVTAAKIVIITNVVFVLFIFRITIGNVVIIICVISHIFLFSLYFFCKFSSTFYLDIYANFDSPEESITCGTNNDDTYAMMYELKDNQMYNPMISLSSSLSLSSETYFMIGDSGYDDHKLYMI